MRTTVNLSKARNAGRQHRAKKAVNKLKASFNGEVKISQELNEALWSRGATKPPRKVELEVVETAELTTLYPAESYDDVETSENESEQQQEEVVDSEGESEDVDYDKIVDNSISEVKEKVSKLEDPDYEALMEAEESNKDRKTLKDWIENQ